MTIPICTLDASGYCERHKRVHNESERPWALDETLIGNAVRREWDRAMSLPTQNSESERGPCRYLTDAPVERDGCGSCQKRWLYPCEVYGVATPEGHRPFVKRCEGCVHYRKRDDDTPDVGPIRRLIFHNSLCPGDVVVSTAAIESLHIAHPGKFLTSVSGTATELFHFNPNVVAVDAQFWEAMTLEYPLVNQSDERPVHFMQGYCDFLAERLGVPVPLAVNRPRIYTSPEEQSWIPQVQEIVGSRVPYVVVNAGHKSDYTAKWWGSSNYQAVVDLLRGRVLFVQVGELGHNHPALSGVVDLRGKTDLRQLVRLVYHSAGGVGPSTLLQHLCAGLDRSYVLLAGGREPHVWQHYPRQATLSTVGCVECTPSKEGRSCWRDHTRKPENGIGTVCDLPVLTRAGEWVPKCLAIISPEQVAKEIEMRYHTYLATQKS